MAKTVLSPQQAFPAPTTPTDLYTVPALKSCIVSTIKVCNQSAVDTTFRISIRVAGAVAEQKQYEYFDQDIIGNTSFSATEGWTLAAGDVVTVYATLGTLSFNLFGVEEDA